MGKQQSEQGIFDLFGNFWSEVNVVFTIGLAPDSVAPQVFEVSPVDTLTAVPINMTAYIRFDEPIQVVSVAADGLRVTFTPGELLQPNTPYSDSVFSAFMGHQDVGGNLFGHSLISTFTTGPKRTHQIN